MGAMDQANTEMNLVWKQAVRLSLKRSIHSATLLINNDRELNRQKKDQLISVNFYYSVCRPNTSSAQVLRRGVQSYYFGKNDEG